MQGKRVDADPNDPHQFPFPRLKPGEFGKDVDGMWYCCCPHSLASERPAAFMGNLAKHEVTEHEDGTITVKPSILVTNYIGEYHGFLEKGVWRTA